VTAIYCGDYTALATTKWGAKIYVDTRDTSLAPHIMLEGDWEPWVTNCMATFLQKHKGCTFIDVGANVGWYTLLACGLGAGHVFSFEPNPRMAALLRKTIMVNGYKDWVTLTEAACSVATGHAPLILNPEEAGGAHLHGPLDTRSLAPGDSWHEDMVATVRLDDVVFRGKSPWSPIDAPGAIIIKIDVEGFEPQVLAGATELLKLRPIMFLEHARNDGHQGMYEALVSSGYSLRHVRHNGYPSEPLDLDAVMAIGSAETVLCLPPGSGGT
jgi:FkbM family methyltransferase